MLKGNERRIVVVERPDDPLFDRAVFFVRVGARLPRGDRSMAVCAQAVYDALRRGETAGSEVGKTAAENRDKKDRKWGKRGKNREEKPKKA